MILDLNKENIRLFETEIQNFIYKSMNYNRSVPWFTERDAKKKVDELELYLSLKKASASLFVEKEKALAFIWAYPSPDKIYASRYYISIVYVEEEARGKSIGRQLIEHIENLARSKGFNSIYLHTNTSNYKSQSFYQHIGFKSERIQYIKIIE